MKGISYRVLVTCRTEEEMRQEANFSETSALTRPSPVCPRNKHWAHCRAPRAWQLPDKSRPTRQVLAKPCSGLEQISEQRSPRGEADQGAQQSP